MIGCQQSIPRPFKEMESAIGLPTAQQSQRIDITYFVFLRSISFRSEKSSRVAAVLNSISSDLQPVSTSIIIGKSSFSRGNFLIQRVRSFDQGKSFKVICARAAPRIVNLYIVSVASFQVGFQPVNIAPLVSKLIWNLTGIQTPGRLSLVPRASARERSCVLWSWFSIVRIQCYLW